MSFDYTDLFVLEDVASGYEFIPVNTRLTVSEALAACRMLGDGARLATVETDEENDLVTSLTSTDYCEPPG